MDNGVNESNNQVIPGVKVAMPDAKPVDASTSDVGAAVGNVQKLSQTVTNETIQPAAQPIAATVAPTVTNAPVTATTGTPTITNAPLAESVVNSSNTNTINKNPKKRKNVLTKFLVLIIILLITVLGGGWFNYQQQMTLMRTKCSPISNGEVKKLKLDSTIVKDLYGKVSTSVREDIANSELNDQLKIYLAYRQIATRNLYESNCNKFSSTSMEPFSCNVSLSFVPKAFKEDVLQTEIKKLFGEETNITNQNIQLGKSCIGGFQYIEERGEYVQGQCDSTGAILYRADKELIDATSTGSEIILTEKVRYYGTEAIDLPNKLVSGTYKYTFRLDMNYNYIYISKELVS